MKLPASRIAPVFSAAILVAATGLVGNVITVHPIPSQGYFGSHALSYSEMARTYLSVVELRESNPYPSPATCALVVTTVNPVAESAATPVKLLSGSAKVEYPVVAWNGAQNRHLIIYKGSLAAGVPQVMGLVVDAAGSPVAGTAPFPISAEAEGILSKPNLAGDGRDWMAVWCGGETVAGEYVSRVYARRIAGTSTNAAPVLSARFTVAEDLVDGNDDYQYVGIAHAGGASYLAAWQRQQDEGTQPGNYFIEGCTITSEGARGTARTYEVPANVSQVDSGFTLAGGAGEYLLGFNFETNQLHARRLDLQGVPLGERIVIRNPRIDQSRTAYVEYQTCRFAWNPLARQYFAIWIETEYFRTPNGKLHGARIAIPDAQVLDSGIVLVDTNFQVASPALASSRYADSKALFQWRPYLVSARLFDLAGIEAPADPAATQYRLDGVTAIPQGGETTQGAVEVHSPVSASEGRNIILEVEIARTGAAFKGIPSSRSEATESGSVASVRVPLPGFAPGAAYHWQSRTVTADGLTSRWVGQGSDPDDLDEADVAVRSTNTAPSLVSLAQLRGSDETIPPGGRISQEPSLTFEALATDADADEFRLEVELQEAGGSFTGSASAVGSWSAAGPARVTVPFPNSGAGGSYAWKARVVDSLGGMTAWTGFGGNADGSPDFEFLAIGSANAAGCVIAASPATAGGGIALLAILLAACRRR